MENQKKSFSQELCENKALISAANTTDLVSLIDEVNYSEETAQLLAGLTNTSVNYVKDVMEEMKAFNENFSEENYPIFIGALNEILQKNSEEINSNFSEYMKNVENFSEEDVNNKIEKLSELISLIDDDVMKDLGTEYVSMIVANSTDTDKDTLKNVLDSYLARVDEDDDVEDKKEEVKDIIDNKGEEMKTELVTEKFNEVFIKKDGQYFKFDDAVVAVPVAGTVAGAGLGTAVLTTKTGSGLVKKGIAGSAKILAPAVENAAYYGYTAPANKISDIVAKTNTTKANEIFKKGEKVYTKASKLADKMRKIDLRKINLKNPKVAIPVVAGTALTGAVVGKKISK